MNMSQGSPNDSDDPNDSIESAPAIAQSPDEARATQDDLDESSCVSEHDNERSEETSFPYLQADQRQDLLIRRALSNTLTARLLAVRCREAQKHDLSGQDFAVLATNGTPHGVTSLCFCVCDGVGSSYRGDFAARYLARHLLAWLQRLPYIPATTTQIEESLRAALSRWAERGQEKLRAAAEAGEADPPGTSGLVREVLMELRETYGAEAVFLAGRVDAMQTGAALASDTPVRCMLCWMGNVSAQVYPTDEGPFEVGSQGDDSARWSTGRGLRGALDTRIISLSGLRRLITFTDGVERLANRLATLSDDALSEEATRLLGEAASDDMTVLDVELR